MPDPWNEIIPGLWMGGDDRSPVGRFDHVVSLCAWGEARSPGPPGQTRWFIEDAEVPEDDERIWRIAQEVSERVDREQTVLVRCQMGLNRSGLITAAVLIHRGLPPTDAISLIRERRDGMALCNPHFERWLAGT